MLQSLISFVGSYIQNYSKQQLQKQCQILWCVIAKQYQHQHITTVGFCFFPYILCAVWMQYITFNFFLTLISLFYFFKILFIKYTIKLWSKLWAMEKNTRKVPTYQEVTIFEFTGIIEEHRIWPIQKHRNTRIYVK